MTRWERNPEPTMHDPLHDDGEELWSMRGGDAALMGAGMMLIAFLLGFALGSVLL